METSGIKIVNAANVKYYIPDTCFRNFSNISLKSLFRIYCILYVAVFIFVLKSENLFVLYCTSVRVCSTMLYRNQCWSVPPPDFSFPALGSILNINKILNYECKSSPNIFFTQNSNCFPFQKTLHRTFQHVATVFHSPKLVAMSRIALHVSLVISYKPFRPQELQNSVNRFLQ